MGRLAVLRVHSWYSLLEGVAPPAALLERAAECGHEALALTDTNSLGGAVELAQAARNGPVRPIIGARVVAGKQAVTALAAEPSGYRSLSRLLTRLALDGCAPAAFSSLLAAHSEGLQFLIDAPALLRGPLLDRARAQCWLEVVRPGPSEAAEQALLAAGLPLGLRPVASTAARLAAPEDHAAYRLLLAVRRSQTLEQLPARLSVLPAHHVATADEMRQRFRDLPDALANTARLAALCRSDVLPRGLVPAPTRAAPGADLLDCLRQRCEEALTRRAWQDAAGTRRRLDEELRAVGAAQMAPYLLAVSDLVEECPRRGWPVWPRGSAGSSLVCCLLGITPADPVAHGLRFERFLGPGRDSPPDIDLDLADAHRKLLFQHAIQLFGAQRVARVASYRRFGPVGGLKAALTAHGFGACANAVAAEAGEEGAGDAPPPSWPGEPGEWVTVRAAAAILAPRPEEHGPHPSGVVLTAGPVEDHAPCVKGPGGVRMLHYAQTAAAAVGLVKLDLLSNRALSSLAEARGHAAEVEDGVAPDAAARVAELLAAGDTLGVPHLETAGQRALLAQCRPADVGGLMNCLSVARPGASAAGGREAYLRRLHGLEPDRYPCPEAEAALRGTRGVLLYDDDALAVIEALTGLPAAEADRIRRALADEQAADAAEAELVTACERVGRRQAGEAALPHLRKFQGYAFCRSHALSIASTAWEQARLKATCPAAFWCGVMNQHKGLYPAWAYVEEAKRAGLTVLPPCVNRSRDVWTQEVSALRPPLSLIRALPAGAAQAVIEARAGGGPFTSFAEARRRLGEVTPDALAALARAGAFDFTGRGREALLRSEGLTGRGALPPAWRRREASPWPGEGLLGRHPLAAAWREEWAQLGLVTGPLMMHVLRPALQAGLADRRALAHGQRGRFAGLVAGAEAGESGAPCRLTLLDERGAFDASLSGVDAPEEGSLAVLEGVAEVTFGAFTLRASSASAPLAPGVIAVIGEGRLAS